MSLDRCLDREALRETCAGLGVRQDVIFRTVLKFPEQWTLACYAGLDMWAMHTVMMRGSLDRCRAHGLLVHELVHAAQTERCGSHARFEAEYRRQLAEAGIDPKGPRDEDYFKQYRSIPFEREAYTAQAKCHQFPWLFGDPDRPVPRRGSAARLANCPSMW